MEISPFQTTDPRPANVLWVSGIEEVVEATMFDTVVCPLGKYLALVYLRIIHDHFGTFELWFRTNGTLLLKCWVPFGQAGIWDASPHGLPLGAVNADINLYNNTNATVLVRYMLGYRAI